MVVHPPKVKLIASAAIETDKIDVFKLAKLLLIGWLPEVWVPPRHVRDLRALISHRWRLVCTRTATKNRLHSVLQRNAIRARQKRPFTQKHQKPWNPRSHRVEIPRNKTLESAIELLTFMLRLVYASTTERK